MTTPLLAFARAMDAAAAVAGKLEKQRILAEFFRPLPDDDLARAVRYAAGRPFGWTDERVLAVGSSIVWSVVLRLLPISPDQLRTQTIASGELGAALTPLWHLKKDEGGRLKDERESRTSAATRPVADAPEHPTALPARSAIRDPQSGIPQDSLTLADLDTAFDALAATGNQEAKREILFDLFARCDDPREATYLAKIIAGDLRTGIQDGLLQAAIAQAFGKDLAAVQRCQVLAGDLDRVALLARRDELACAAFTLFHPLQFMLATPQEMPADAEKTLAGRTFLAEDKLDGIRAQVHKQGDRVAIFTRTMDRADAAFPDVVAAMKRIPHDFLLDGEIVPVAGGGTGVSPAKSSNTDQSAIRDPQSEIPEGTVSVSAFMHLQRRLGRKEPSPAVLDKYPVQIVAFDLLYLDGELLMDAPLTHRRVRLEQLVGWAPPTALAVGSPSAQSATRHPQSEIPRLSITRTSPATTAAEITAAFDAAKARRNEGLILKDPASPYSPGRRGKLWLKLKGHLPTLDCVVTAAEFGTGKRARTLSDYTFAVWSADPAEDGAKLLNIGKAYSGVTDAEIAEFTALFPSIATHDNGHTFWVKPQVVLEIAFDQIQRSSRHASGYALRFPRIKTIRRDKRPEDADRLARVEEVFNSEGNTSRDAGPLEKHPPVKKAPRAKKSKAPPEPGLFDHL